MRRHRFREGSVARRTLPWIVAALPAALGLAAPAAAEPVSAVVEMFTSQGCTACRAADPIMRDLATQPGVIALTLPVTYWDYLGWQDTAALRAFNERQRAYAHARGARQVMTPQAVVNGGPTAKGSSRTAIERVMHEASPAGAMPVPVTAEVRGGQLVVEIGGRPPEAPGVRIKAPRAEEKGDVWLVPLLKSQVTTIAAGENDGRVATYVNVVRGLQRLGTWTGQPTRFEIPASSATPPGSDGWVVLLQYSRDGRLGRILGAAKGPGV